MRRSQLGTLFQDISSIASFSLLKCSSSARSHRPSRRWLPSTLSFTSDKTLQRQNGSCEFYAHELQHLVQRKRTPRLHAVNGVLYENLKRLEPTTTVVDIPT